jgi:lipopolysaccharide export system protein LptA
VAMGNVVATQGETTITADRLTANYRDGGTGKSKAPAIYELIAEGHVVITSAGDNQAFGDHAVYNLDDKRAVMTGQELKLQAPGQTVTARDRFEYWTGEGRLVAVGDALAIKGEDSIAAETITAWFADDGTGKRVMARAEADKNVTIATPTERASGTRAIYTRGDDIAVLEGPVKITRGPSVLNGTRAEVNLKTNVSTVFGDAKSGTRVKGTFYPEAKKK